jgi:[acyl-carrier-protein] S-malonyltransferase
MLADVPEQDALSRLLDAAEALSDLDLRAIVTLGPETELADTRVAQPLLYLADWAWGCALLERGLVPVGVAGHSLGELAALAIAGVYSVEAGLELVVERSRLMAKAALLNPGTMAAVLGMAANEIGAVVSQIDGVWIANDNSPGQIVISGTLDAVGLASNALVDAGARKVVPLKVAGAFHSPLMESAGTAFEELVRGAEFADASVPVFQNTDPTAEIDGAAIRERLIAQITSPVRWTETMFSLAAEGPVTLVESGPGAVLTGLARRVDGVTAISAEAVGIESILQEVS